MDMEKKRRHSLVFALAAAMLATACVYDYNPQIDGEGGFMIVSGDIVLGEQFTISLSNSWSLVDTNDTSYERMRDLYSSKMHIEDSRGGRYESINASGDGMMEEGNVATFDMSGADLSLEYRLVIENPRGTYASGWETALPPGQIDSLSYRISDDRSTVSINVSSHADGSDGLYRWTVSEDWEYHSDFYTDRFFIPAGGYYYGERCDVDMIATYRNGDNLYFCWSKGVRPETMIASTDMLSENRVVDHQLYTLGCYDERVSVLYSAKVTQARLSREAYDYYMVQERNSSDVGGLFSPEPSELRGNVRNLDDPSEKVLGYVSVLQTVSERLFIDNARTRFYKRRSQPIPPPDTLAIDSWRMAYMSGKLPTLPILHPVTGEETGFFEWYPARCVDCRYGSGGKDKPDFWPNDDI